MQGGKVVWVWPWRGGAGWRRGCVELCWLSVAEHSLEVTSCLLMSLATRSFKLLW